MNWKFALLLAVGFGEIPQGFSQLCSPRIDSQHGRPQNGYSFLDVFKPTSDGGYILAGSSYSGNPDQTDPPYGFSDAFLLRLDANFSKVWDRTFGGNNYDRAVVVEQLPDGGYIVSGDSWSPASGNKTSPLYGVVDFWLVRTDADGNKLWDRSYGGTNDETLFCFQQTSDGGFIMGGSSASAANGNKTSPKYGYLDYWVVRTDADGNKLWDRSFGGTERDALYAIQQTSDGGFLLGGTSESPQGGNKTAPQFGGRDYWIIRLDADGNEIWQTTFGGYGSDELVAIGKSDHGFALVGSSDSPPSGNKTSPNRGYRDYWIVFVDANGGKVWEESAGGPSYAEAARVLVTADDGWVIGGSVGPGIGGNKTSEPFGSSDYWLVRFDVNGSILWDQAYGGTSYDNLYGLERSSDGGIFVSGESYSDANGNKTIPSYGSRSLWTLKLGVETPGDCDGDGIADADDLCPATAGGSFVSTNGCSIAQLCPCDAGWRDHDEYVACVEGTSADLLNSGRITPEQHTNILAEAAIAACPFPPILAFGLTNFPIHQAGVSDDSGSGPLYVSNLGFDGSNGVSMRLGEADSGVFIYPDAPVQYNYDEAWFMLGKAFGSLNGVSNSLLSTIRARKPYYETYPVDVDFSSLGATSLTFQVFASKSLVVESTQPGATGSLTINSASYLGPRANPFWRAADGSIGAAIDLDTTADPYRFTVDIPLSDTIPYLPVRGDHIFVRANIPANVVEYVSRMDITMGGGLSDFSILGARLGMFRRPHLMLGNGIFNANGGKLKVTNRAVSEGGFVGTLIEASRETELHAQLEPLRLDTNGSILQIHGSGTIETNGAFELFGNVSLTKLAGALQLNADFSPLYPAPDGTNTVPGSGILIKVYNNGSFVGSSTNSPGDDTLLFDVITSIPAVVACGATVPDSLVPPYIAFTLDQHATLHIGSGTQLRGNYFRLSPIDPQRPVGSVSAVSLGVINFPSFTITGETTEPREPRIAITRSQNSITLSWPNQNQPFILQSTPVLGAAFEAVTDDVSFVEGNNTITLPIDPSSNRFFQLKLSQD